MMAIYMKVILKMIKFMDMVYIRSKISIYIKEKLLMALFMEKVLINGLMELIL